MSYETICEQNRYLFGRLEELTCEINRCKADLRWKDIDDLQHKKESIQTVINLNLDKLDAIWEINKLSYKKPSSNILDLVPKEIQEMIIDAYRNNPMVYKYRLAIEFNVSTKQISTIINNHLNNNTIPA